MKNKVNDICVLERTMLFVLLFLLNLISSYSQTFSGRIMSEDSVPVSFATVYSRTAGVGLTADQDGAFSVNLDGKSYKFEVSALGFITRTVDIDLSGGDVDRTILLKEQIYRLDGVTVTNRDEDPANRVIRYAIATAESNKRKVSGYDVNSYVKGKGKIKDMPAVMKKMQEFRKDSDFVVGRLFVMEGVYDVRYRYPEHYDIKTRAFRSSFPFDMPVNIWNPSEIDFWDDFISMGGNVFSLYKFSLEGYYMNENGRMINKIKVSPRRGAKNLFYGYLYIVEDLWCISDMDINMYGSNYNVNLISNFKEVLPGIFLPVSSSMKLDFSAMGLKVGAGVFSSYNYSNISSDYCNSSPDIKLSEDVLDESVKKNRKIVKIQDKIDEIMSSGELTTQQALKIYRLNEKLSMLEAADTLKGARKYNLDNLSSYKVNADPEAMNRDSAFWDSVRSVPLLHEEIKSYETAKKDTLVKQSEDDTAMLRLLYGRKFYTENKKWWLRTPGIDKILTDINTVDGFNIGATVGLGVRLENGGEIMFEPWAYYLTHRKDANYGGSLTVGYAPLINGKLKISGGKETADYNGTSGYIRYLNMLSTYIFGDNYSKFYDNRYFRISNETDIANGLNLLVGAGYEHRAVLDNSIDRLGRKVFSPNIPDSKFYSEMPKNSMFHFYGKIEYTPALYYRIVDGRKRYVKSKFPTVSVSYEYGRSLDGIKFSGLSHYNRIEAGIRQKTDFLRLSLAYWANAGMFFDSDNVFFPDYRHAAVNPFYLSFDNDNSKFFVPGNYEYSTSDKWINCGLEIETGRLLLNWLPFLDNPVSREGLSLNVMAVPGLDMYTEFGYRLSAAGLLGVGVYVGLKGKRYDGFSLCISLPFYILSGNGY